MRRLRHPIRAIREPFGTAGLIVACLALLLAMGGGAVAAKGGLTGKQKRQVAKIAKKEARKLTRAGKSTAGKAGPAGAAGPAGTVGEKGANGINGLDGKDGKIGKDGVGVVTAPLAPGEGGCVEGGTLVRSAGATDSICNGEQGVDGAPGPEGVCSTANCVLPSGPMLTGAWSFSAGTGTKANDPIYVPISYVVPTSSSPGTFVRYMKPGENENSGTPKLCKGGPTAPEVEPTASGNTVVCIWASAEMNWTIVAFGGIPSDQLTATKAGLVLTGKATAEGIASGYGVWAVRTKP